jgi:hypothetical protein
MALRSDIADLSVRRNPRTSTETAAWRQASAAVRLIAKATVIGVARLVNLWLRVHASQPLRQTVASHPCLWRGSPGGR